MSIGLIFRFDLTIEEQIWVEESGRVPDVLEGYLSGRNNPELGFVSDNLQELKMPWSKEYVPMFVYADRKPEALADVRTGAWGHPFELNPASVLPDLSLVCRTDVQNAARDRKPADWFTDLRPLS